MFVQISNPIFDEICKHTDLTARNTAFDVLGWDGLAIALSVFALGVSIWAAVLTLWTYRSQKRTEENTQNTEENTQRLTLVTQRNMLMDMIRHLYRNMVIVWAIRNKLQACKFLMYPSEEHLIKLNAPLENIHLNAFFGNDENYIAMNDLYLKLRNYNDEITVAMIHLSSPNIDEATKLRDLNTLLFKSGFLTYRIIETVGQIWKEDWRNEAIEQIKRSRQTNARTDENSFEGFEAYKNVKSYYVTKLFGEENAEDFFEMLNQDAFAECGLNNENSEKIHLIKFKIT